MEGIPMSKRVVTLAHYYTAPEIQQMADKVGDSLELSLYARDANADVIVFAVTARRFHLLAGHPDRRQAPQGLA